MDEKYYVILFDGTRSAPWGRYLTPVTGNYEEETRPAPTLRQDRPTRWQSQTRVTRHINMKRAYQAQERS